MKNTNVIGSVNKLAFEKIRVDVESSGISLMKNGSAFIPEVNNGYKLNGFAGNYDFYKNIKEKSLQDLDMSGYDFTFSLSKVTSSQNATTGVIFPVCETFSPESTEGTSTVQEATNGSFYLVRASMLLPFIFKSTLIAEIITQAGFQLDASAEIFTDPQFRDCILSMNPPNEHPIFDENTVVNVSEWMHDIPQVDFLKSFMFQYGLSMTTEDNTVIFHHFKDNYKNMGIAKDWSDKLDTLREPVINFNVGYAIDNVFEYEEDDEYGVLVGKIGQPAQAQHRRTITSDNKNLIERRVETIDMAVSNLNKALPFTASSRVITPYIPCFVVTENDDLHGIALAGTFNQIKMRELIFNRQRYIIPGLGSITPPTYVPATFFYSKSDLTRPIQLIDWVNIPFFDVQPNAMTNEVTKTYGLDFDHLVGEFYNEMEESMIKDPTKVSAFFNLNPVDIELLNGRNSTGVHNAVIPIYIKKLNGYFRINRISKFITGKLTKVDLVKL